MYVNFEKLTDDEVEKVCKELLRQAFDFSIYSNKLDVKEVQPHRLEYTYGRLLIVFAPSVFNDRVTVYPDITGMCGMFCTVYPEIAYDEADVAYKFREGY